MSLRLWVRGGTISVLFGELKHNFDVKLAHNRSWESSEMEIFSHQLTHTLKISSNAPTQAHASLETVMNVKIYRNYCFVFVWQHSQCINSFPLIAVTHPQISMALSHMNFSSNSNDNQQRHMGYASTSSSGSINSVSGHFRQAPRSTANELTANKEKGHHASRPKFQTLKGKSWSAFTDAYGCDTSELFDIYNAL